MKKVTLLGDSIRMIGYGKRAAELLSPEFEVWQPEDNCRYSQYTLWALWDDWAKHMKECSVVHWNNGLWDIFTTSDGAAFNPIDSYVETMVRIARILKSRHDSVIFATITPVRPENPNMPNDRIVQYNERIVPELQREGVVINDLHSLVKQNVPEYICDDLTHLSETGIEVCAQRVAEVIRAEARKL